VFKKKKGTLLLEERCFLGGLSSRWLKKKRNVVPLRWRGVTYRGEEGGKGCQEKEREGKGSRLDTIFWGLEAEEGYGEIGGAERSRGERGGADAQQRRGGRTPRGRWRVAILADPFIGDEPKKGPCKGSRAFKTGHIKKGPQVLRKRGA